MADLPPFRSFQSTVSPFTPANWPVSQRLLVNATTGAPVGLQTLNSNAADGIWVPVDLSAAQIAAPTAAMIDDLNAMYRLDEPPYTRYYSSGTALVEFGTGTGNFLPLTGGTMTGPLNVTATGTVTSRSVQTHFGEALNIKDFGAFGDGVINDRFAIIAALNAAAAGNVKTVYFPPSANPYLMGPNVTVPSGVTLFAYPGTVTIKSTGTNSSVPLLLSMEAAQHDILIYGLILDGNVTGILGGSGVKTRVNGVVGASRIVFDHCRFQNTNGLAVQFANSTSYSGCRNCSFDNIGQHWQTTTLFADAHQSITFTDTVEGGSVGNFVENCVFTNVGSDCINAAYQTGLSVHGNRGILNNQQWWNAGQALGCALVFSYGSRGTHVVDNIAWQASGNAFDFAGEIALSLVGNKSYHAGEHGISIGNGILYSITTGAHHAVISSNLVLGSGQNFNGAVGLAFVQGGAGGGEIADVVVTGNTFSDDQVTPTQSYGIAALNTGFGLPTLTRLVVNVSNHMAGNITAAFGGGLGYATADGAMTVGSSGLLTASGGFQGAIGASTPSTGAFTTLGASGATTLSSGVSFGSTVAPGGATDLSKHIALFGTNMGFSITANTLNIMAGAASPILTLNSASAAVFAGNVRVNGSVGFYNTTPIAKPTVAGVKLPSDTVMASLLTALAAYGLITDTTT